MGGDINLNNGAPEFLVWAVKDPIGHQLDRIQIIKGWYEDGEMKEKIYNVAVSEERSISANGTVSKTNASVDLKTGKTDDTIGAITLSAFWKDPDFNPSAEAFYYARVIENPSLRWSAWDKLRYDSKFAADLPDVIQERAWSSPIWYSPK